jgi:tRNA-modifying protein YgfZ
MTLVEEYRALKEKAVVGAVAPRSAIAVRGKDRKEYLHGLLTNDIRGLMPGRGCYAAWLTPQGRMLTDLHVFDLNDMILLDVPAQLSAATFQRLDRSLFSEDVQLADLSHTLTPVWVHGPDAAKAVQKVLALPTTPDSWLEYQNERFESGGGALVLVRVDQLGVPGFGIFIDPAHEADLRRALEAAGAPQVEPATIETARVEAGYPLFGIDMTEDTIPLEAGIENRAISFTKGCYVGQEVIIRVLHRGHGRVVRKLIGLRLAVVPSRNAKVFSGDREIGWVTSAASSPRMGPIALGYVHRDFVAAGVEVVVESPEGRVAAVVSEPPILSDAR